MEDKAVYRLYTEQEYFLPDGGQGVPLTVRVFVTNQYFYSAQHNELWSSRHYVW